MANPQTQDLSDAQVVANLSFRLHCIESGLEKLRSQAWVLTYALQFSEAQDSCMNGTDEIHGYDVTKPGTEVVACEALAKEIGQIGDRIAEARGWLKQLESDETRRETARSVGAIVRHLKPQGSAPTE